MIAFNDLAISQAALNQEISQAVQRVLSRGWYVLGPEVDAFEKEFAAYHGVSHAVTVANGTDAIELALRAAGIGPGDEVITVAHTAVPTVCAIEGAGAKPVLVDIDSNTYTMDPGAAAAAITPRTAAIVPVHLYGHPADMPAILKLARSKNLLVIEDCAQAHGARLNGQLVGTFGDFAAFSFYPTKNLGACGDGGAILANDQARAERLKRIRTYGQSSRYQHAERGVNSRLDEMQAAILRVKLPWLNEHNRQRRELATHYASGLRSVMIPSENSTTNQIEHVYHLYVIRDSRRDAMRSRLEAAGIGTQIHYPVPVHLQQAYGDLSRGPGSLPITERICREILSLPLYPGLSIEAVDQVAQAVNEACKEVA